MHDDNGNVVCVESRPCFAHGQLTVALTRVGHPDRVTIYLDGQSFARFETPCPMYPEALLPSESQRTQNGVTTGPISFDTVFGTGIAEATDWPSELTAAERLAAAGHRWQAIGRLMRFNPPMWSTTSEEPVRWYRLAVGDPQCTCDAVEYTEVVTAFRMHAMDALCESADGTDVWQTAAHDYIADQHDIGSYAGPSMDYHPSPLAFGDDDLSLFADINRAWNQEWAHLNVVSDHNMNSWNADDDVSSVAETNNGSSHDDSMSACVNAPWNDDADLAMENVRTLLETDNLCHNLGLDATSTADEIDSLDVFFQHNDSSDEDRMSEHMRDDRTHESWHDDAELAMTNMHTLLQSDNLHVTLGVEATDSANGIDSWDEIFQL